jgi:hypothetical protein
MTERRSIAAGLLAAVLGLLLIPLAAPGPDLVPGADAGFPGWLAGPYGDGFGLGRDGYRLLLFAAVAAWAVLVPLAGALGRRPLKIFAGAAILLFALAPPLLSLDVFSYISYGRLGAEHGLNPYDHVPADIPGDEAAARVQDFRDAVSVYGPLFTLGSYPLALLGVSAAMWSLKAVAAIAIAAMAALTARLARLRGADPAAAAAFVALNPLVLVHLVGGAHNDGLMTLLALAAVAAALAARPLTAGASLAASVAVKAAGALYAPFIALGAPRRGRLIAGFAVAAAVIAAAALLAFGTSATEALSVAGNNQSTVSRWSVPATLSRITAIDVDVLRVALGVGFAALVLALLVRVGRGGDWVRAAGWAALGLLVASAYMAPWYVIWLLPLAAISRDRLLIAGAVAFTVLQVPNGLAT